MLCCQAALSKDTGVPAFEIGTSGQILRDKGQPRIERRFVLTHIAHAPLKPVNATAATEMVPSKVLGGSIQSVTACREAVAMEVGGAVDAVRGQTSRSRRSSAARAFPIMSCRPSGVEGGRRTVTTHQHARRGTTQHVRFPANAAHACGRPRTTRATARGTWGVAGQSLCGASARAGSTARLRATGTKSMVDGIYNQRTGVPHSG